MDFYFQQIDTLKRIRKNLGCKKLEPMKIYRKSIWLLPHVKVDISICAKDQTEALRKYISVSFPEILNPFDEFSLVKPGEHTEDELELLANSGDE